LEHKVTTDPERWKIGDRRLHGQPRGWFPGPWWLVDLEEASEDEPGEESADEVEEEGEESTDR
jgi:hypothetical protein